MITAEVKEISEMDFTGNVIPNHWFDIVKTDTGKPDITSIVILSEIVYWYRWTEERDDLGRTVSYKKKFNGDLLQKNYAQLSQKFGITERQARNSIVRLEELGFITRVLRNVQTRDRVMPNVMFIQIHPDALRKKV